MFYKSWLRQSDWDSVLRSAESKLRFSVSSIYRFAAHMLEDYVLPKEGEVVVREPNTYRQI